MNYKTEREYRTLPSGRKKPLCKILDCTNYTQKGGTCIKHGAKHKRCKMHACDNQAQVGGVCVKHGAKQSNCTIRGCGNLVRSGGVCVNHGANQARCKIDDCTNKARKYSVCVTHGAKEKRCKRGGCTKQSRRGGVCIKHGSQEKRCRADGCEKHRVKGGYCVKHHPDYVPIGRLSRGAQAVMDYLRTTQLPFETEKRFPKCKHINTLPFDFYIPIYNLCIEYDGIQHTKSIEHWGGQQGFELTQKRDGIKNKYCKDNKINILRIPHTTKISQIPHLINAKLHSC